MGFFAKRTKMDIDLLELFEDWLAAKKKLALMAFVVCPTKDAYTEFLSENARVSSASLQPYVKLMSGRVSDIAKFMTKKGTMPPGGLTDQMIVATKGTKSYIAALARKADVELESHFQTFLKSKKCETEMLKAIKVNRLVEACALPDNAAVDLVPVAIKMKTYEDAAGKKLLDGVMKKYKRTKVSKMTKMWEKNIRKNGSKPLAPGK